jgi:hypothetical protein
MHIFTGDFIFKGLTARRLYKSFGVKGLNPIVAHEFRNRNSKKEKKNQAALSITHKTEELNYELLI